MSYTNGRLPASALSTVEPGMQLAADGTDDAYRALRTYAADRGRVVRPAAPAGAYRSFAVQAAMHHAGSAQGTAVERRRWGLNPSSVVAIAAAGYSTHGTGTRVDLVGTDLDWIVQAAARFGFHREFGARDPNHFVAGPGYRAWAHDVPVTKVVVTGRTGAETSGNAFWRRVQLFARLGGYNGPVDGVMGTRSWAGVNTELHAAGYGSGFDGLIRWGGGTVRKTAAKLNRL